MTVRPAIGDPAPDAFLLDKSGSMTRLSFSWRDHAAVLVFLRYFGCPFCQMHVVALRADEDRFREADAAVVLIGQGSPEQGARFCAEKRVSFTCLLDPHAFAYEEYGLGRGSIAQVFGLRVISPFLSANVHAETRQRGMREGSMMQMPGTFVVDAAGVVRLAHRNRTIADSPRNEMILDVLAGLGSEARDNGNASDGSGTDRTAGTTHAVWPAGQGGRAVRRAR